MTFKPRHITMSNGEVVTLYSKDGRSWFMKPKDCLNTEQRVRALGDKLRREWRTKNDTLDRYDYFPVGDDGHPVEVRL